MFPIKSPLKIFNKVESKAITHPENETKGHDNGIFKDDP